MADFCHQCSIDHFGEDFGDLKGLITPEEVTKGLGAVVICEGCGFVHVDHLGRCLGGTACSENHTPPPKPDATSTQS